MIGFVKAPELCTVAWRSLHYLDGLKHSANRREGGMQEPSLIIRDTPQGCREELGRGLGENHPCRLSAISRPTERK